MPADAAHPVRVPDPPGGSAIDAKAVAENSDHVNGNNAMGQNINSQKGQNNSQNNSNQNDSSQQKQNPISRSSTDLAEKFKNIADRAAIEEFVPGSVAPTPTTENSRNSLLQGDLWKHNLQCFKS